LQLGKSEA